MKVYLKRIDVSGGRFRKELLKMEMCLARPGVSTPTRPLFPHELLSFEKNTGTFEVAKVMELTFKITIATMETVKRYKPSKTTSIRHCNKSIPLVAYYTSPSTGLW